VEVAVGDGHHDAVSVALSRIRSTVSKHSGLTDRRGIFVDVMHTA
jgi:hypothetical protein